MGYRVLPRFGKIFLIFTTAFPCLVEKKKIHGQLGGYCYSKLFEPYI